MLWGSLLPCSRRQEGCTVRRGRAALQASAWRFPRKWKSKWSVLPLCLTFHLLTLLPRRLDLVGKLGVGSAGHDWGKRSGVWLFPGAFAGKRVYFRLSLQLGTGCAVVHIRLGTARLSGHKLVGGAVHCSLGCGGRSHPL